MKKRSEVIQWLKDKGLYEKVKRKMPVPVESYPFEDSALRDFFLGAFDWKYSSEGEEYWRNVNKDYQDWFGPLPVENVEVKRRSYRTIDEY